MKSIPPLNEVNFDGIVGPTHNYAGLSHGNVASTRHSQQTSHPKQAVLQGLKKAKSLADAGWMQAVLPPQPRPSLKALRDWGLLEEIDAPSLKEAKQKDPRLLSAAFSASSMWTANAATVSPSIDTKDSKLHFTPSNLFAKPHRAIEARFTEHLLKKIFTGIDHFTVHSALDGGDAMSDEGAANHTRLFAPESHRGLHLFVYGREALNKAAIQPKLFPARQTLEASKSIARRHGLKDPAVLFIQQNPEAIDAGVFHNDVIAVGNADVLFCHEKAFLNQDTALNKIRETFHELTGQKLTVVEVPDSSVTLQAAVTSYLFNSQLLLNEDGSQTLVAPEESRLTVEVKDYLDTLLESPECPISQVLYFDLKESMSNGGGPACLRLRVSMTETEQSEINGRLILDNSLYSDLVKWAESNYCESLTEDAFLDTVFIEKCQSTLLELERILELPGLYSTFNA